MNVDGGSLFVTNATHDAFIDVRNGQLNLNGGVLHADKIVMTNTCGVFVPGGGTLVVDTFVLATNTDADGDGMPNGWEQVTDWIHSIQRMPLSTVTAMDFRICRSINLGLIHLILRQAIRITAIAQEGNNVRVTWTTVGGFTNFVQVGDGTTDGSYTNNFSDLSPQLIISGSTVTSTNFLELSGATNNPARFYRIRVLQ